VRRPLKALWVTLLFVFGGDAVAQPLRLPNKVGTTKFAVFGDTGTGGRHQYEIGERAAEFHKLFPFTFALLLGDNLYGSKTPQDFKRKFELPYKALLDEKVKFYAALGNHDVDSERQYALFNMNGKRYYSFKEGNVRFFALDTTYIDREQIEWLEKELASSKDRKICFFHHPLYSSAKRHGGDEHLRSILEPMFVRSGVHAVFSGHDHTYERMKPQKGIYYWVVGSSAKLRKANIRPSEDTDKGFDQNNAFMLVEIDGDTLHFQTISRSGETVDAGAVPIKP
jgi:Calcineurin-like phosphoesterase